MKWNIWKSKKLTRLIHIPDIFWVWVQVGLFRSDIRNQQPSSFPVNVSWCVSCTCLGRTNSSLHGRFYLWLFSMAFECSDTRAQIRKSWGSLLRPWHLSWRPSRLVLKMIKVKEADPIDPHSRHFLQALSIHPYIHTDNHRIYIDYIILYIIIYSYMHAAYMHILWDLYIYIEGDPVYLQKFQKRARSSGTWVAHGWRLPSRPQAFGTGYHATTCDWRHRFVSWTLSTKYQRHAARQSVGMAQVDDLHRFVFQALLGFESVGERERAWRYLWNLVDLCCMHWQYQQDPAN